MTENESNFSSIMTPIALKLRATYFGVIGYFTAVVRRGWSTCVLMTLCWSRSCRLRSGEEPAVL